MHDKRLARGHIDLFGQALEPDTLSVAERLGAMRDEGQALPREAAIAEAQAVAAAVLASP
jgi:hypothetical protein